MIGQPRDSVDCPGDDWVLSRAERAVQQVLWGVAEMTLT